MSVPTLLQPAAFYAQVVADLAAQGWIDPPSNLARSHVYMFTGQADQVVNFKTVELGASLYRTLGVPESQIVFRYRDLPARRCRAFLGDEEFRQTLRRQCLAVHQ